MLWAFWYYCGLLESDYLEFLMTMCSFLRPQTVPCPDPQVQLVFLVTVKTGAPAKLEPRESQETPALQASLGLRVLLASVTPVSVPTMPAWHKDLTPKTWRGNKKPKKQNKEEYRGGAPSPGVFRNLSVSGTIWEKKKKNTRHDGGLKRPAAGLCLEGLRQASVDYFRFNLDTEGS